MSEYKWIARDANGKVYGYTKRPIYLKPGGTFVRDDSDGFPFSLLIEDPNKPFPIKVGECKTIEEYERIVRHKDFDFDWHDVTIKMSDDGEFMVQSKGLTSISAEIVGAFKNLRQMQQKERREYFENETTNNN